MHFTSLIFLFIINGFPGYNHNRYIILAVVTDCNLLFVKLSVFFRFLFEPGVGRRPAGHRFGPGVQQNPGTFRKGAAGGADVIDEEDPFSPDFGGVHRLVDIPDVFPALVPRQAGLAGSPNGGRRPWPAVPPGRSPVSAAVSG